MKHILSILAFAFVFNVNAQCDWSTQAAAKEKWEYSLRDRTSTALESKTYKLAYKQARAEYKACQREARAVRFSNGLIAPIKTSTRLDASRNTKHKLQIGTIVLGAIGGIALAPELVVLAGITGLGSIIIGIEHDKLQDEYIQKK